MNSLLTTVFERMISVKRPHEGYGEGAALAYVHLHVVPKGAVSWIDGAGNLHVDLRESKENRTLFIAHIDTMHFDEGPNQFDIDDKGFYLAKGDALGADDGAGVAILSVLMQSIPAYYIFCRGEERGGVGSRYIADSYPKLLMEFDRAIAFDRAGYSDVITWQSGGKCTSGKFADALADQLNDQGLLYMPSDRGVYTDTAEFTHLIPECTNISCGYFSQHGAQEKQDGRYLQDLCAAALNVNWDGLPTEREPGDDGFMSSFRKGFEKKGVYEPAPLTDDYEPLPMDDVYPIAQDEEEEEIANACFAAIDGSPDDLMDLVGRALSIAGHRLDEVLFEPSEVMAIISYCNTWREVLNNFADEAETYSLMN